ncbi:MAG: hypothetical protein JNK32_05565 [Anaerolineales bacterium]|nr:hypothetical protein [Anaerolineales bacterium]
MKPSLQICMLALLLASCQSNKPSPNSTVIPTETPQPTMTSSLLIPARQNEITSIWENSVHAQAAEPVNCSDCHPIKNGVVLEEVSWRNQQTGQYEAVSESNSLCRQCHADISAGHAHMTFTCTDCHNPHKVEVSCTNSGCHSDIPTIFFELPATPTGGHPASGSFCGGGNCHSVATAVAETAGSTHGPEHALVTCEACHDASQFQVGPSLDDGKWRLWQEIESNGTIFTEIRHSHDIQLDVDCARCHFENNPWGLPLITGQEAED